MSERVTAKVSTTTNATRAALLQGGREGGNEKEIVPPPPEEEDDERERSECWLPRLEPPSQSTASIERGGEGNGGGRGGR